MEVEEIKSEKTPWRNDISMICKHCGSIDIRLKNSINGPDGDEELGIDLHCYGCDRSVTIALD